MEVVCLVQVSYDVFLRNDRSGEMWEEVMVTVTKFGWSVKRIFFTKTGTRGYVIDRGHVAEFVRATHQQYSYSCSTAVLHCTSHIRICFC